MSLVVLSMAFISACNPLIEESGLQFSFSTLLSKTYANPWAPLTLAKVFHSAFPEPFLITALVQCNQMCKLIQIVPSGLQASIAWRIWANIWSIFSILLKMGGEVSPHQLHCCLLFKAISLFSLKLAVCKSTWGAHMHKLVQDSTTSRATLELRLCCSKNHSELNHWKQWHTRSVPFLCESEMHFFLC